jgi:NADH-quinone oxidoreductase subunit J
VKTVVLCLLLALVGGGVAYAQPQPVPVKIVDPPTQGARDPHAGHDHGPGEGHGARPPAAATEKAPKDRDKTSGSGGAMAALFWIFALGTIGGSIFVITRRNLIAAVMGMVATFFAVAALYMMLYANFLAVIQMLVYAGAIMVLFVFVVMILNKPEDEPWGLVGLPGKALAGIAMLYLLVRLGGVLWDVKVDPKQKAVPAAVDVNPRAPEPARDDGRPADQHEDLRDWGSTAAVGANLFDDYLFPFEAVSILLLVAVVGAIAVARPLKDDEDQAAVETVQS